MFDTKRFMNTQFIPREEDVPVPDLKDFFEEGEKPVWRVRNISGQEMGVVNETVQNNRKALVSVIEKMFATMSVKDAEKVSGMVTDPDRVTDEMAKRLEMLVLGSVSPEVNMDMAIKLCRVRCVEFFDITNTINRLTGLGHEAKKKPGHSGKTRT